MSSIGRITRFMEHFWLAVAIGTLVAAGWVIFKDGFEEGKQWLMFPAVAFGMFLFRRFTRKKLEAIAEREAQRRK